jgi:hypothetical protein
VGVFRAATLGRAVYLSRFCSFYLRASLTYRRRKADFRKNSAADAARIRLTHSFSSP